jgi:hypothetical protein
MTKFRIVLMKLNRTPSKTNDNCGHGTANDTEQDGRQNDSNHETDTRRRRKLLVSISLKRSRTHH